MNHYHTALKEVLFTFAVDGPRHAEMPRTKMKIRETRGKKAGKQLQMITLFLKEIFDCYYLFR